MARTAADDWKKLKGKPRGGARPRRSRAPRKPDPSYNKAIPEAVVKVAAWGKSMRSADALAQYIAEGSEHVVEREQLIDQDGFSHDLDTIHAHLVESWGLVPDSENLSPAARSATARQRADMPEAQRLQARQVVHMVLSWPKDFPIERHQAEAVAAEALRPFNMAGHKSLMVYHSDKGRPHIHVMLQVRSSETGRALVIGPRELQILRERQAAHTREMVGRHMQATRREERAELRRQIEQGKEPLRTRDPDRPRTLLERQVPGWYTRHGYQYEARRVDWKPLNEPMAPLAVRLPPLPKGETHLDQWAARFAEPEGAKDRWREMASEATRTAFWYANNRPEVFGVLRSGYDPRQLNARQVHVTDVWRQEAAATIARSTVSPQVESHRLEVAQNLREAKKADQQRQTAEYMNELLASPTAPAAPAAREPGLMDRIPGLRAFASLYEPQAGYQGPLERRLQEQPAPEQPAAPTPKQQIADVQASLIKMQKDIQRLEALQKRYSARKNWTEFAEQRKKTAERLDVLKSDVAEARNKLKTLQPPTLLQRIADRWKSGKVPEQATPAAQKPERPPATLAQAVDTIALIKAANTREIDRLAHIIGVFDARRDKGSWATERLTVLAATNTQLDTLVRAIADRPTEQTADMVTTRVVGKPLHEHLAAMLTDRIAMNAKEMTKLEKRSEGWAQAELLKLRKESDGLAPHAEQCTKPILEPTTRDELRATDQKDVLAEARLVSRFVDRIPGLRALVDSQGQPTRGEVLRATDRLIAEDRRIIDRLKQTRDRVDQRGGNTAGLSKAITDKERGLADLEKRRAALQAAPISASFLARRMKALARNIHRPGPPTRER